ncbi:hypothetical protein JCM10450v2_000056 [Rhodotorula kratochvilovae]
MGDRPEKDAYQLLATGTPVASPYLDSPAPDGRRASTFDGADDDELEQGHAYPQAEAPAKPISTTSLRSPLVLVAALAVLAIVVLGTALAVPSLRHSLLPSTKHGLQRVERDLSISLNDYLHARFNPDEQVIMFTMATGEGTPDYVPQARNWDAKRAELGMDDSVVVLCLDAACLDKCERGGLRAYGGYLSVDLPPESARRLAKRGKERGHRLAYLKFLAMLEMAKSGFPSLFFEGDTFLTTDPFPHMLSLSDPSWDIQFTEDVGYTVNFGWIFARPSKATVALWQRACDRYVQHNEWDQQLLSNVIRNGAREYRGEQGDEHWWLVDDMNLRVFMLPLSKFRATHPEMLNWYTPEPDLPEPVMNHLTAVTFPNRQFYPKERGWSTNLDSFYSRRRPILTSAPLNGTLHEVLRYARTLYVLSAATGRALLLPEKVTVYGVENGTPWTYTRSFTRFVGIQDAVDALDLLEPAFFAHAAPYLTAEALTAWQSSRAELSVPSYVAPDALLAAIGEADVDVIVLTGWEDGSAKDWTLKGFPSNGGEVIDALKGTQACQDFHIDHLPFPWCKPLPVPVP